MKKETVTLNYTLVFEIGEQHITGNLVEAYKEGFMSIVTSGVSLYTKSGNVCDDKDVLTKCKQSIEDGLLRAGE